MNVQYIDLSGCLIEVRSLEWLEDGCFDDAASGSWQPCARYAIEGHPYAADSVWLAEVDGLLVEVDA